MLDHLAAIAADSARLADVVAASPLDAPVPSCPDWRLRDLALHLGRVHRFWADQVVAGEPSAPRQAAPDAPPADADLVDWLRAGTAQLLGALEAATPEQACWTWWGAPLTVGAVARHQVQEAAVHRWDAEGAMGTPHALDPEVAADGVAEFLEVHGELADLAPVELVAVDTGGRWVVGGGGEAGEGTGARPRATVRASASDLVLLLHGRIPPAAVERVGDAAALDALLAAAATG